MGVVRGVRLVGLAMAAGLLAAGPVAAGAKISVKTEYYRISGETGADLLRQMDRRGPNHGFMSKAIAQTRYSMNSSADWRYSKGVCRARDVTVKLSITYIYPRPNGPIPAGLERRWKAFMKGVVVHEETHGRIASQMASAAAKEIYGIAVRDGPNCGRVQREMKRRIDAIVAEYEARQQRFDQDEHRNGGQIDRLVSALGG